MTWHRFFIIACVGLGLLCVQRASQAVDSRMIVQGPLELFQSQTLDVGADVPYPDRIGTFDPIEQWVHVDDVNAQLIQGKPVLVHFWSYGCAPCLQTTAAVQGVWKSYHAFGLEVVGIHTPSHVSEANSEQIAQAIQEYGLSFPIGLDTDAEVWDAFSVRAWPTTLLFDQNGVFVAGFVGAGSEEELETAIQSLLQVTPEMLIQAPAQEEVPESIVLGFYRQKWFASPQKIARDMQATYTFPETLKPYQWALEGEWVIQEDRAYSVSPSARIRVQTIEPDLAMSFSNHARIQQKAFVYLNGLYVPAHHAGSDLLVEVNSDQSSYVITETPAHYNLIQGLIGSYQVDVVFPDAGAVVHGITFDVIPAP